jgi:hypothetical protein
MSPPENAVLTSLFTCLPHNLLWAFQQNILDTTPWGCHNRFSVAHPDNQVRKIVAAQDLP